MQNSTKIIISIAMAGVMANQATYAGSFSLYTEISAAEIGNFAAGAAAEAADASTGFYNPAGLTLLNRQEVVLSGVGVLPSSNLTGTSTFSTTDYEPYIQSFSNLQGGKSAVVPALHYAQPLGEKATFGLSIFSPFGLSTNWGDHSPVRHSATLTKLLTVDVSPELGGLVTKNFAVGGGLDFQWANVNFNRVLGSPAALQALEQMGGLVTPTTLDSSSDNEGHSFGIGFHAGVLGLFNDNHTRAGLNYQSRVKHQFNGSSTLTGRLADPDLTNIEEFFSEDTLYSNQVPLPSQTTFSLYQDINPRLAFLGSVIYTGWSCFKTIKLNQVAAFSSDIGSIVLVDSSADENYKDTWRFALGANYQINDQWMLRTGGGYDETPTVNEQRDVRLPDANRWALSIGGHYQMRPYLGFDLGYTYLWAQNDPIVNKTDQLGPTSNHNVDAKAKVHAQLIGLQAVWSIDHELTMK